jgi:hypothetical protein
VLRRYVRRAGWWVAANGVAWVLPMVIVFVTAGLVPPGGLTVELVAAGVVLLALAGGLTGAVHGLALVWLLRSRTAIGAPTR